MTRSVWLPYYRPAAAARLRLFCFPYAGGGASLYNGWASGLPAGVDLCAVQLPGRENRLSEAPLTHIDPLVRAVVEGVRPFLDLPFALFGHSMGARIAFELARALRRESGPMPLHLFVSGSRAPQLPRHDPVLHGLPDEAFVQQVQRLNGLPEAVVRDRELRELFMPILRADFTVVETYACREEEPLGCPITAFGGLDDPKADRPQIEAWGLQTSGPLIVHMLAGDHFFLQSQRARLLQTVSHVLGYQLSMGAANDGP